MLRKSVYIVGPSSTGKTTLCTAFAKHIGIEGDKVVSELARTVMNPHGFTRLNVGRLEMQEAILDATLEKHHEARELERGPTINDRSAVDPVVYSILAARDKEEGELRKNHLVCSAKFQKVLEDYRQSTFMLLNPVREWIVDDGVRTLENLDECCEVFRSILEECGISFHEIGTEIQVLEELVAYLMTLCT